MRRPRYQRELEEPIFERDGWHVDDRGVLVDNQGEPVSLTHAQDEIMQQIVEKWKRSESGRRASKTFTWLVVVAFVTVAYLVIVLMIGLIQTGWGWIPGLAGIAALVLIWRKGWWKL